MSGLFRPLSDCMRYVMRDWQIWSFLCSKFALLDSLGFCDGLFVAMFQTVDRNLKVLVVLKVVRQLVPTIRVDCLPGNLLTNPFLFESGLEWSYYCPIYVLIVAPVSMVCRGWDPSLFLVEPHAPLNLANCRAYDSCMRTEQNLANEL